MQTVVPMLAYEDAASAIEWLCRAFGFTESGGERYEEDGRVTHAELDVGDGSVVYVATPTSEYHSPRRHREECAAARRWSETPWVIDGVVVAVHDVDGHRTRAAENGATMLSDLEDAPFGRLYRVEDVEGHRWMFIQPASWS